MSDPRRRIEALRAKADSTTFPAEAAALRAKADEFEASLPPAQVIHPGTDPGCVIMGGRITFGDYWGNNFFPGGTTVTQTTHGFTITFNF